jgi:hypothetical protein
MLNRLLIGAIAVVVIGVAAYFLSQPRKGSVEYHKREYLRINKRGSSVPWVDRRSVPHIVGSFYGWRLSRQSDFHYSALIEAGYLRKSVFMISNSPALDVLQAARIEWPPHVIEIIRISWDTNRITITAPSDWIEKLGPAIREADAPETK